VSGSNTKRGLGRGFETLIPTDLLDDSFDPTAAQDQRVSDLRNIRLDQIIPDPNQPRRQFVLSELEDLAASIKEHGVLQPIILTPHGNEYKIVAGERRYRASLMAGLEKIPALVRSLNDQNRLEISLIENLQRSDLNSIETATAYLKLKDQFNLTLEEIGRRVGNRNKSTISNTLRLLRLPKNVQQAIVDGKLTEGQTRPLIGLDEAIINKILPKILSQQWSSRRIEQFIADMRINQADESGDINKTAVIVRRPYERHLQAMTKRLHADVRIDTNNKGAGKITIRFKSKDEFERLYKLLGEDKA
jgi:ParB family transcriptional regulator, chromosome partitioning protein